MAVEVGTAYVTLKVDGRGVPAGVKRSMSGAEGVAAQAGASSGKAFSKGFGKHTIGTEQALNRIGKVSGRVFLAGAAGIAYAEKKAADFNAQMATVFTLSHANTRQQQQLAQAAKSVGVNIGYSATNSAAAEEELIKAGVKLKDILGGGLKGALDLAAAGQTDVATATEVAASAMTQFRLKGQDVPHIADLLAAGADKALGSVTDLGYGLAQVGTVAHQMGFSIEGTTGTLAEFAQSGLLGEKGGAALKQMFLRLANPTKKSSELMDQYGLSLYKANGQIKTLPELAGNLQRSFENLTPAQRNAALGTIFGSRAIQAANILVRDGEKGNRKWIRSVDDQGFAAHQAAGKMNSLKGDVSKLSAEFQNVFINASGKQNFLRTLTQDGTKLLKVYDHLSDSQRSLVNKGVLGVVGGAGALYAATKIFKLAKSTSELYGWATGRGASKALGGAALGRATKGVTPVFVTNPGFGGVGAKGKPAWGGTAAAERRRAEQAAGGAARSGEDAAAKAAARRAAEAEAISAARMSSFLALAPFSVGLGGPAVAKQWRRNPSLQSSSTAAFDGGGGKARGGIPTGDSFWFSGKNTAKIAAGFKPVYDAVHNIADVKRHKDTIFGFEPDDAKADSYNKAIGKIDTNLAHMAKVDPGGTWKKLDDALRGANVPLSRAAGLLPKTAVALGPAAVAAGRYSKVLHTLPKSLRTDISAPGSVKTLGEVNSLQKVYHLTPKQVATIMRVQGFSETQIRILQAGKAYRALPKEVRTKLRQDGAVVNALQVRQLQQQYHLTPKEVRTLVKVAGLDPAIAGVRTLKGSIDALHDKTVHIGVVRGSTGKVGSVKGGYTAGASGMTVPGLRSPYGDKVLAHLAPGEEVISNRYGQADRNRALLKAINANRYAGGGTVGGSRAVVSADGGGSKIHALTITNWDEGTGYIEEISDTRYYANRSLPGS